MISITNLIIRITFQMVSLMFYIDTMTNVVLTLLRGLVWKKKF